MAVSVIVQLMEKLDKILTLQAKILWCLRFYKRWQIRRFHIVSVSAGAPNCRVPDDTISHSTSPEAPKSRTLTKPGMPSKNDCIEWRQSRLYILRLPSSRSSAVARRHFDRSGAVTALSSTLFLGRTVQESKPTSANASIAMDSITPSSLSPWPWLVASKPSFTP